MLKMCNTFLCTNSSKMLKKMERVYACLSVSQPNAVQKGTRGICTDSIDAPESAVRANVAQCDDDNGDDDKTSFILPGLIIILLVHIIRDSNEC